MRCMSGIFKRLTLINDKKRGDEKFGRAIDLI